MTEYIIGSAKHSLSAHVEPSVDSVYQRIRRLYMLHGAVGIIRLLTAKLIGLTLWWTPARRRARSEAYEQDLKFDRKWGVDTSGKLIPAKSEVVGSRWIHGSRYQGVDADVLEQVLGDLAIDHKAFTFIDFGSGKGRAILTAACFPFRKIVGVEYSELLHNIAAKNVSTFRGKQNICGKIDLLCADALDLPIPAGPLIIFMYNPFGDAVMKELLQRISQSYEKEPRKIVVLYFYPTCLQLWQDSRFLEEVKATSQIAIFESKAA